MRGFIVLCLSAVALAAPDAGYNYSPSGSGAGFSVGSTGFGSSSGGSLGFGAGGHGGFSSGAGVAGGFGGGFGSAGVSAGSFALGGSGYAQNTPKEPIISKRFFIHSAPEERDDDYKERHITVGTPRKNYNVVFVKAPASSSKKATIKITPAVNEEKTVVYVLTKKGDAHDINTEVLEQPQPTTKPEVFFIKYNTAEEAAHAQEQIQAQYDSLGGSSQVTDEGVAPVTSVIGSLNSGNAAGHGASGPGSSYVAPSHGPSPRGGYLPPARH